MRESIGAAWLMIIVMTFIVLFSGYLAFSVNYSKAFRVKNGIVERITKHNGLVSGANGTLVDIDNYLAEIGYSAKGSCYKIAKDNFTIYGGVSGTSFTYNPGRGQHDNYCVVRVKNRTTTGNAMNSAYYKVYVFFSLSIGAINIGSTFHTTGETQTLYFAQDDYFGF